MLLYVFIIGISIIYECACSNIKKVWKINFVLCATKRRRSSELYSTFLLKSSQVQYSWLWKLANVTQNPYSYVWSNDSRLPELINGPPRRTMYVTALYFTMTCMTSVCSIYFLSTLPKHCLPTLL